MTENTDRFDATCRSCRGALEWMGPKKVREYLQMPKTSAPRISRFPFLSALPFVQLRRGGHGAWVTREDWLEDWLERRRNPRVTRPNVFSLVARLIPRVLADLRDVVREAERRGVHFHELDPLTEDEQEDVRAALFSSMVRCLNQKVVDDEEVAVSNWDSVRDVAVAKYHRGVRGI